MTMTKHYIMPVDTPAGRLAFEELRADLTRRGLLLFQARGGGSRHLGTCAPMHLFASSALPHDLLAAVTTAHSRP